MASILIRYQDKRIHSERLTGIFRGLSWETDDRSVIVVGDKGRIVRIRDNQAIPHPSGTHENLRAISTNTHDGTALIVGNSGTIITSDQNGSTGKVEASTRENLRHVSWNSRGDGALVVGNRGVLLKCSESKAVEMIGARANLRRISWRPDGEIALITSNCFAEEFIPSPNLFSFDLKGGILSAVNEGRADLIGVDWESNGKSALVAGYDVIWHNGYLGTFDGQTLSPVTFENKHVYPVSVSWSPSRGLAAIATATTGSGIGEGAIYLWDRKALTQIFSSNEYFFSTVAWNHKGTELAAIGSSMTRTFNC